MERTLRMEGYSTADGYLNDARILLRQALDTVSNAQDGGELDEGLRELIDALDDARFNAETAIRDILEARRSLQDDIDSSQEGDMDYERAASIRKAQFDR